MLLAFDLEGCLVETRAANLAAYREAGVEPPANFHAVPWQMWCSASNHDKKQARLAPLLCRRGRLLPASRVLLGCGGQVLTAASRGTVDAVLEAFPDLRDVRVDWAWNLRTAAKIEWMNDRPAGVYFDDCEDAVELVRRRTRWQVVLTRDMGE
jgi:hypothetical protein